MSAGGHHEIEVERYELSGPPAYLFDIERRTFLAIFGVLGGGLLVASVQARAAQESGRSVQRSAPTDVMAWVHVGEDGKVTGYTGKTEIGQNIRTSLAQAIADELRVPLDRVSLVMADTDLVPFDQGTFGSQSTPRMAPVLSRAAATAREMLIDRAAERLSVARASLTSADGQVSGGSASLGYGELVKGRRLTGVVPADAPLMPRRDWKTRGTAAKKVNGRSFVTGAHRYTPDLTRPNMLHGRVLRPNGYTGTLASLDDSAARAMDGVIVVRDGNFAGVVAPTARRASRAGSGRAGPVEGPRRAALVEDAVRPPEDDGLACCWGTRIDADADGESGERTCCRSPNIRRDVPHPLHRARAARAPCRCGRVDRRQAHRLDGYPTAVRRAHGTRDGISDARGPRPRHRAGHRVGLRWQAHG